MQTLFDSVVHEVWRATRLLESQANPHYYRCRRLKNGGQGGKAKYVSTKAQAKSSLCGNDSRHHMLHDGDGRGRRS